MPPITTDEHFLNLYETLNFEQFVFIITHANGALGSENTTHSEGRIASKVGDKKTGKERFHVRRTSYRFLFNISKL